MGFLQFFKRSFLTALVIVCVLQFSVCYADEGVEPATKPDVAAEEVTPKQLLGLMPDDRYLGSVGAPVIMIEYASLACSHCAEFTTKVFPKLKKEYVDTGKVLYIYRDFPLDRLSLVAAMLGECYKGNQSFFSYIKAVFGSFETLIATYKDLGLLSNIAKISNISSDEFKRCTTDESLMDKVINRKFLAVNKLNVDATPAFFIDGRRYESSHTFNSMAEEIERALVLKLVDGNKSPEEGG